MTNQASVFAENDALKQTLGAMQQASQQRAGVILFMFIEGLATLIDAANAGDPGAKQVCRQVSDLLGHAKGLASGIVVAK